MNDAISGFLTGFFDRTADISKGNRERADEYYAKQLERAQTVGLTKLQERKDRVKAATGLAQSLTTQAQIPPHIINRVAEGGLDQLTQLQEIWNDAASKGIKTDKAFWEGVYGAADAQSGDGGNFNENFSRIAGMNMPPPPEKGDSKMSWHDALYGTGDMDRAWSRLDNTEVADGMSAGDLLRAEQQSEQIGAPALPNPEFLADKAAEAERAQRDAEAPTDEDKARMNKDFEDYRKEYVESHKYDGLPADGATDEERRAARQAAEDAANSYAAGKVVEVYGSGRVSVVLPHITQYLAPEEGAAPEVVGPEGTAAPQPKLGFGQQPAPKSAESTELPAGVRPKVRTGGATFDFAGVAKDGRIIYESPETGRKIAVQRDTVMETGYAAAEGSTQATQQRLDAAMKEMHTEGADAQSIYNNKLFIGADETPPDVLNHPLYGPVRLAGEDEVAYYYEGQQGAGTELTIRKK